MHLDNTATVAGLLSGGVATMLQFSYLLTNKARLSVAVDILWFMALVSAVSSAITSVLGKSWNTAVQ